MKRRRLSLVVGLLALSLVFGGCDVGEDRSRAAYEQIAAAVAAQNLYEERHGRYASTVADLNGLDADISESGLTLATDSAGSYYKLNVHLDGTWDWEIADLTAVKREDQPLSLTCTENVSDAVCRQGRFSLPDTTLRAERPSAEGEGEDEDATPPMQTVPVGAPVTLQQLGIGEYQESPGQVVIRSSQKLLARLAAGIEQAACARQRMIVQDVVWLEGASEAQAQLRILCAPASSEQDKQLLAAASRSEAAARLERALTP